MPDNRFTTWIAAAPTLVAALPAQEATDVAVAAMQLMKKGKFADALPMIQGALAVDASSAKLHCLKAACQGKLGQHEDAIQTASKAIQIAPDHAASYGERAYNYYMLGQRENALLDYDRSLALEPNNPMAHGERGDLLLDLHRSREAMVAFDRAIALAPYWPNPHSQRAEAALQIADFVAAKRSFQAALRLAPDDTYYRSALARALYDCGLGGAALVTLQPTAAADSSAKSWLQTLQGRLAWQLNRHSLAIQQLARARNSGDAYAAPQASLSLACLHLALGSIEAARDALDFTWPAEAPRALVPWAALMRWCADYAGGDPQGAATRLRSAIAALPEVPNDIRQLVAACLDDTPQPAESANSDCAALFFAGWRALCDNEESRAESLWLRCINTGAKEYQQWHAARTLLLQRLGNDALATSLGVEWQAADPTQPSQRIVQQVAPAQAAALQGLQANDVIVHVSDARFDAEHWPDTLADKPVGHDIHLTILRDGKQQELLLQLGWCRR